MVFDTQLYVHTSASTQWYPAFSIPLHFQLINLKMVTCILRLELHCGACWCLLCSTFRGWRRTGLVGHLGNFPGRGDSSLPKQSDKCCGHWTVFTLAPKGSRNGGGRTGRDVREWQQVGKMTAVARLQTGRQGLWICWWNPTEKCWAWISLSLSVGLSSVLSWSFFTRTNLMWCSFRKLRKESKKSLSTNLWSNSCLGRYFQTHSQWTAFTPV